MEKETKYKEVSEFINNNIDSIDDVQELIKLCPILNCFYTKTLNDFHHYIESQSMNYLINKIQEIK